MRHARSALIGLLLAAAPAAAQPLVLSGNVEGHLGYALNPRLRTGREDTTGFAGARVNPVLTRSTATSTTSLAANYRREDYFTNYGHTQAYGATLSHDQTFSERLRGGVNVGYSRSNNLLLNGQFDDASLLDNFTTGRNTESLRAGANLSWQMSARDSLNLGGSYQHQKSRSDTANRSFDSLGGTFNYMRAVSQRTQVGLRAYASTYKSSSPGLPDSTSIAPALALQQTLNAYWKLDADVGVSFQRLKAPLNLTNKALSFHLSLCGTYPRSTVCLSAARQASASAFGGLRQQTSVSVDYSYKLTERSTLSLSANYLTNEANRLDVIRNSRVFRGNVDYNQALSQRLSVGAEARGGYRSSRSIGTARSVSGSVYVRLKIGRVS